MSRSYRRLAEQPVLMRHPGEGERKERGKKELKKRKESFSALSKLVSISAVRMGSADPLDSSSAIAPVGRARVQTRPL